MTPIKFETIKKYAINLHATRQQLYAAEFGLPYSFHLKMVESNVIKFQKYIPDTGDEQLYLRKDIVTRFCAAAYCHDLLEDTGITYNDLKIVAGKEVADIVYDVTDELGKNRDERHKKTYPKIAKNPSAVFLKLCDRIANIEFGIFVTEKCNVNAKMLSRYVYEHAEFVNALQNESTTQLNPMFDELNSITQIAQKLIG